MLRYWIICIILKPVKMFQVPKAGRSSSWVELSMKQFHLLFLQMLRVDPKDTKLNIIQIFLSCAMGNFPFTKLFLRHMILIGPQLFSLQYQWFSFHKNINYPFMIPKLSKNNEIDSNANIPSCTFIDHPDIWDFDWVCASEGKGDELVHLTHCWHK